MYYDLRKKITVTKHGKNDLGIYVTYLLEGVEKNLGYPKDEADNFLLDAIGEGFDDLVEFSQHDAIAVACLHEENLQTRRFLNRIEMGSFANSLNN